MRKRVVLIGLVASVAVTLLLVGLFPTFRIKDVSAKQIAATFPIGVAIGDYDDDGLNDIAIAENGLNRVTVYKSDLTTMVYQWIGLSGPAGVAIGDYNNDGRNDLAVVEINGPSVTVYRNDLPTPTILYQWNATVAPWLTYPWGVAIGDYNNDGLNELAFADYIANTVIVYKNDLPNPTVLHQWSVGVSNPLGVAIGDYDNDGLNDLAFSEPYRLIVYKSDFTTIIKQWTSLDGLNWPMGVTIGDYNNDGLNELAFAEMYGYRVTVYKSDTTSVIQKWTGLNYPYDVVIGDLDDDGLNDLAFSEASGNRVAVYFQTKPGTVARVAEPTIVTLRGTLTDNMGYPIVSGSIRVTIKDSLGMQVWQDVFDSCIDNGKYNLPLGTKTMLRLIKGQIYNAILEVDAYSATFVSTDVTFGDSNPAGDLIKFVAD